MFLVAHGFQVVLRDVERRLMATQESVTALENAVLVSAVDAW